jgi:hypothetical protein
LDPITVESGLLVKYRLAWGWIVRAKVSWLMRVGSWRCNEGAYSGDAAHVFDPDD